VADRTPEAARPTPEPPPHVTAGLLDHLTATSLDEDYAHVSARRRSTGDAQGTRRPGLAGLVVLTVFGVLVATAAVQTSRNADESASSRASLVEQVQNRRAALQERQRTLRALQRGIAARRASQLAETQQGRVLQARLSRLGVQTGTVAARGPGIRVLVDDVPGTTDSREMVQAPDLQKLVNGLWQVGAEAVAINGQRLTAVSPIRDAGSAVTVNFTSLRRPYTVSAIGNRNTMPAQLLDTEGGQTWQTLKSLGLVFDVQPKESMVLPAAKPVSLRSAREPGRR